MTAEELQALGVHIAELVGAKVKAAVDEALGELRSLTAKSVDAGLAATVRAGQVEDHLMQHDWRLRRLENENGLDHTAPHFNGDAG